MKFIDLSHRLSPQTPPYPGDAPMALHEARVLERDGYTGWHMAGGMHLGTHVDVPMHLLADSRWVADFTLESFCGPGQLIRLPGADIITADMLGEITAPIVLVATGWDTHFWSDPARYFGQHPRLTDCAAKRLLSGGVTLLGLDSPSPDRPPFEVHKALLGGGVLLCENLTGLGALTGLRFNFYAAPLKLEAEGSPVRAFAVAE